MDRLTFLHPHVQQGIHNCSPQRRGSAGWWAPGPHGSFPPPPPPQDATAMQTESCGRQLDRRGTKGEKGEAGEKQMKGEGGEEKKGRMKSKKRGREYIHKERRIDQGTWDHRGGGRGGTRRKVGWGGRQEEEEGRKRRKAGGERGEEERLEGTFHANVQGGVTPIDSIVPAATARSKLWPALFGTLTACWPHWFSGFDCWLCWISTVDRWLCAHLRKYTEECIALVYGLTSAVTAVTIESMGVTPLKFLMWIYGVH